MNMTEVPQSLCNLQIMQLAEEFAKWRLCMSYNYSYFGEPAGELKRIATDIDRLLPTSPRQTLSDIEFLTKLEADINALRLRLAQGKG